MSTSPFDLVFHPAPPADRGMSGGSDAFASAVRVVLDAGDGPVCLVSPYLGLAVLAPIVVGREFRLITDVEACFDREGAQKLLEFLVDHASHVRDLPCVHAKVVLSSGAALFGSANLTTAGFCERFELGCLLRDSAIIAQILDWFDALYDFAAPIDVDRLRAAERRGKARATARHEAATISDARETTVRRAGGTLGWMVSSSTTAAVAADPEGEIRARAAELRQREAHMGDREAQDNLVMRLRTLMRSESEAKMVLEHLAEALTVAHLKSDDPRLYVNCRTATSLHVNISSLAVAWCNKKRGETYFGMMLADRDLVQMMCKEIDGATVENFKRGHCLGLKVPLKVLADVMPKVRSRWHGAIRLRVELKRKDGKPYYNGYHDNHHSPFFYTVLTNPGVRDEMARLAFPPSRPQSVTSGESV